MTPVLSFLSLFFMTDAQRLSFTRIEKFIGGKVQPLLIYLQHCYDDIPHDVTAWTLPDTMNID